MNPNLADLPYSSEGRTLVVSCDSGRCQVKSNPGKVWKNVGALKLLMISIFGLSLGSFVVCGVIYTNLIRYEGLFTAVLTIGIGGTVGLGIAFLGLLALRWMIACFFGSTSIEVSSAGIMVSRGLARSINEVIPWSKIVSIDVSDLFIVAHEVRIIKPGHTWTQILAGHSQEESVWVCHLLRSLAPDEPEENADIMEPS